MPRRNKSDVISAGGVLLTVITELMGEVHDSGGCDADFYNLATPNGKVILRDVADRIVQWNRSINLTVTSGFMHDFSLDHKLLADVEEPTEFSFGYVELASPFEGTNTFTSGHNLRNRVLADCNTPGHPLQGCNLGQRHGEAILREQHLIPRDWRDGIIILPGTLWNDGDRDVMTLLKFEYSKWVLTARWTGSGFHAPAWLLKLNDERPTV